MKTSIQGHTVQDHTKVWTNWGSVITSLSGSAAWMTMTPQEARKYAIALLQAADRAEESQ